MTGTTVALQLLASLVLASEPASLRGKIHFNGKLFGQKALEQCLFVPTKEGRLSVGAVIHQDGAEFYTSAGKVERHISLPKGIAGLQARVAGNVVGIYMRPPYGDKENALGAGKYEIIDSAGKTLLKIAAVTDAYLTPSPAGDFVIAPNPGHAGHYGPPMFYRTSGASMAPDWPKDLHSSDAVIAPDGKMIAVEVSEGQSFHTVFLNSEGKREWEIDERGAAAFSTEGIVAHAGGGNVRVYSAGKKSAEIPVPGLTMSAIIRFSKDNRDLLIGDKATGKVMRVDLAKRKILWSHSLSDLVSTSDLGKDVSLFLQGVDATPSFERILVYAFSSGVEEKELPGWGKVRDPKPLKSHLAILSADGTILDEIALAQEQLLLDSNIEGKTRISADGSQGLIGTRGGILSFGFDK